jgi:glycosyltransferase involved in cell wall biosynthesis/Flp pilus assembly protein TadD
MWVLSRTEFNTVLDAIDSKLNANASVAPDELRELEPVANHWALQSRKAQPLRRLSKLFKRAGDDDGARQLLERAHAVDTEDAVTAQMLACALAAKGRYNRALSILKPFAYGLEPDAAILSITGDLQIKLGFINAGLALHKRAARNDKTRWASYISALVGVERHAEALASTRRALATDPDDPALCLVCYRVLLRFSDNKGEIERGRNLFAEAAEKSANKPLWLARLVRLDGDFDRALALLTEAIDAGSGDEVLRKERAAVALAHGYWGRDAGYLLDGLSVLRYGAEELRAGIQTADQFLQAQGGSLTQAAADPTAFADVKSPESVFEWVTNTVPVSQIAPSRPGLVMIVNSLGAGGAERIVATCFRQFKQDPRFAWVKLYLFDLSPDKAADFYLPLTGLDRSEIVLLDSEVDVEAPLSWLPKDYSQKAQSILDRLKKDRPAIVHATLEPLSAIAGLAALQAGVPRVVMHSHNMRPTELVEDGTRMDRVRGCLRALLTRPEVTLVGCADACMDDYVDWIDLSDRSNIHTVYNGFDATKIEWDRNAPFIAETRAALGIAPDAKIFGTAIRFTDLKQPFLWVDAAEQVLAEHPNCHFVMYGDGLLRAPVEDYIRSKGLSSRFSLPGLVSDLYRRLAMFDAFVLSSRTEGLPNVLLEAQAAGVPVISFDVGGVRETMIDGVTGILVKTHNAEGLAAAMVRALTQPGWLGSASAIGRAFVDEKFSVGGMFAALSSVLLENSRPRDAAIAKMQGAA